MKQVTTTPFFRFATRFLGFLIFCMMAGLAPAQERRMLLQDVFFEQADGQWIFGNEAMQLRIDPATGALTGWHLATGGNLIQPGKGIGVDVSLNGEWLFSQQSPVVRGYRTAVAHDARSVVLEIIGEVDVLGNEKASLSSFYRIFPGEKNWERWASFSYAGSKSQEPAANRFDGFRFSLPGLGLNKQKDSRLHLPGPFFIHTFVKPGSPVLGFADANLTFHSSPDAGFGLIAVSEPDQGTTLASWVQTAGQVASIPSLEGNGKQVDFLFTNLRAHFLQPFTTIHSDVQHVVCTPTLNEAFAAYRDNMAHFIPMDTHTPDWVKEMVLLEVYPSYFPDGFRGITRKLAFYKSVGFNTLYLMPHWKGGYFPLDLYAVNEAYGTKSDLKQLVAEAHALGMKVLFDMVIHGFSPKSEVVNQRPDLFVKTDSGKLALHPTWKSVTTDWASPAYQQYMADLVRHDAREYGIDGYRVDAATYKGAGWNPSVPYPAYRDGSAAPELMASMLAALRETQPDAVLLSEVFGPAFYGVCNLAHDNQTEAVQLLLEKMEAGTYSAQDYKRHLAQVFAVLPKGANRVFFARNHDTSWFFRFGGYTPRFLSMDAVHIFFAIPEFFAGDPNHQPNPDDDPEVYGWYRQMLAYRKRFPEFCTGDRLWNEVETDDSMVFSGLRKSDKDTHLVLINMSGQAKDAEISLNLPREPVQKIMVTNPVTGKTQQLIPSGTRKWRIRMDPFEVLACRLSFRP